MIELKSPEQIARAKVTGALVAEILQTLRRRATVGANLLDIDRWAKEMIAGAGATSCYVDETSFARWPFGNHLGPGPFGRYICTSVNDDVLHGRPHNYALADWDLLTLDLAVALGGFAANSAISFIVGGARPPESDPLIDATERALAAGIAAAVPGARLGDLSSAIGAVLGEAGYAVNLEFGGHGIGSTLYEDPCVPNDGRSGHGLRLRPGLMLTLEPYVMENTDKIVVDDDDGWTLRSSSGCQTAHSAHTIAITEDGADIITLPGRARG